MKKFKEISMTFAVIMLILTGMVSRAQTRSLSLNPGSAKKVAILPLTYVGNGNQSKIDEMRYRLQNIAYLYLKEEAVELTFQDPAETNALLLKKGVRDSNFRQFTPRELAELLEVEYVLTGMVIQESTGTASIRNSNRSDYERRGNNGRETIERSKLIEELNTNIDLNVYNDKGERIYSKSRRSILSRVDAYKDGIQYLLKRSPIYKK